jgi:hypothetical protein
VRRLIQELDQPLAVRAAVERGDHRQNVDAPPGRFFYELEVPAMKSPTLSGGEPRYACCHHTEGQGHSDRCDEVGRRMYIEDALRRAGISFRIAGAVRIERMERPGETSQEYRDRTGEGPDDDPVNHPRHYNQHPAGIECIVVIEHMTANVANAVKYLWRAGFKPSADLDEDLAKAVWYVERERVRVRALAQTSEREARQASLRKDG